MSISATDVNKLRQMTGAGMMDCKKALTEAEGNFDKAVELLRKKGQKVADNRQDREAKEGGIFARVTDNGRTGIMFELNCETDFVARNDDFQGIGNSILDVAEKHRPATIEALYELKIGDLSIKDTLVTAMGRIGEKIDVSKYAVLEGARIVNYIHPGAKVGVLVQFDAAPSGVDLDSLGRDIAMQVAAMNPVALDKDGIETGLVEREIEIGKELARQEGKPENMLEKIAMGKLNKFYKEKTLLNQEFVKDPSKTISQYIAEYDKNLKVVAYKRMHLGQE